MNKLNIKILLVLILVSIFSCNSNVGNENVSKDNIDQAALELEVKDVIASTLNFFQTGSIEDAKAVFSNDAVLIGTDEAEYLTGWEEIEPSIIAQLAVIRDAKFDSRNLKVTINSSADMASYTSVVDFSFTVQVEEGCIKTIIDSVSVTKMDGVCKTTQEFISIPLPVF